MLKVFNEKDSSFTAPTPNHSILWEMGKMARRRSINYCSILQLDMLCKKEGEWTKVPYIQIFFFLRDHPKWLSKCRLDTQTMVTLYKMTPDP
jgi:hypothetical protein